MKKAKTITMLLVLVMSLGFVTPLFATNWLDSQAIFPYDKNLSLASDITSALTAISPAAFAFAAPASDWVGIGLTYAPTYLASYGMRTLLKGSITRERPYQLPGNDTLQPEDTSDFDHSFPSGHTLLAFSSAAYTQTVFSLYYPDSPYKGVVTATTWALAATTALLRVASGNHFVTDVLAGAAIGSVMGFSGPYLSHLLFKDKEGSPTLFIGPTVGMQIRL